jgi:hypothetical protein
VSDLLFDGYTDPLLSLATTLPGLSSFQLPGGRIGYHYGRNGSAMYDGVFNTETGEEDIQKLGVLRHWRYSNRTEDGCGQVLGFAGGLFPPGVTRNTTLQIFASDICR